MAHGKAILTILATLSWITVGWTTGLAEEPSNVPPSALSPASEGMPIYEVVPQLTPPADDCLEHWSKVLGEPTEDELTWRERQNHGIYRVGIGDKLLARVELLSSASPAACETDPDWRKRQTQILVTYFLTDGTTREVLYEILDDDVFYDRSPQIHAAGGIIVLQGVSYDGSDVQITLELDLMRELYDAAAPAPLTPRRPALTASKDAATGTVPA